MTSGDNPADEGALDITGIGEGTKYLNQERTKIRIVH